MNRNDTLLIAATGVATYVLFKNWRRFSQERMRRDRQLQREARSRWEGEGGYPATETWPEAWPETYSPTV
jgi:hypothetical protein